VKWSQRLTSVVTAVCFVALVALGVDYVVHADGSGATTAREQPGSDRPSPSSSTPSPSPQPTISRRDATVSARPSQTGGGPARRAPVHRPTSVVTPTPSPTPTPLPPPTLEFVLTTFNMLGASHTAAGGTHSGYASGEMRARGAAALIRRHGSDVIGFQELQGVQLASLRRHTDLDFWPGLAMSPRDSENSLAWRRDKWTPVEEATIRIPYFDGGPRVMPVVRLRSRSTGLEAWFANFHNPADTKRFHHQQRFRTRATLIETRLANQLITRTGLPVFVTGDMNERSSFFCRFTARTPMVAARGGSNTGRCLPRGPGGIDWIFGSQGVQFSNYQVDDSHLVDITTDHPVVSVHVRISGDAKNPGLPGGPRPPGG
jgi:Endonuclease/Exonuclease/phosphatase family